jgi:hypothetical protein
VESSGRFLAAVLEGGQFLGTIRNQSTLQAALSNVSAVGTLFIVGHSDQNYGYLCKGKVLISKALSLAEGKASTVVFLMCYSSEMAGRSHDIAQRTHASVRQRFEESRKAGRVEPERPFQGFVGLGHGCSTSAWGDDEELDLVSSVALLVKALARWPCRPWSTIAGGVAVPTSASMDGGSTEVSFTSGRAYGDVGRVAAPRVRLSEEHRARLSAALVSLRRELYDGNPHAERPCGEAIT